MPKRNMFKYACVDCGWTGFFRLNEFARRCRPRCGSCGSTFLEPTHDAAESRIRRHGAEYLKQRDRQRALGGD